MPYGTKKIGIERRVYTSGKSKSFLDPFKEEKQEDIDRLKNIQEQIHENFIEYVRKRRGAKLSNSQEDEVFSGLFWVGKKGVELGLADGVGSIAMMVSLGSDMTAVSLLRFLNRWLFVDGPK